MNGRIFLFRIGLDFVAIGLLLAALAYYWLDNRSHELIGTAMFLLIVLHNIFNRRWYGSLARTAREKSAREPRRAVPTLLTVILLATMAILLVTSILISRDVFGFLGLKASYTVREIHMLAAYWGLVIVSIHLGMSWSRIMNAVRNALGITGQSFIRTSALRGLATAIAAFGIASSFEMTIGSKLLLSYTLDMWDFEQSTMGFFLRYASIVGLYAMLGHYAITLIRQRGGSRTGRIGATDKPS